ncbi:hypothetical protein A2630_02180 [Candidatus Woesebacteria bacterium RIFCSPHIGHO2_01_FULL_44_10]|uniref:ArnT-like N-terminal domain-containing protein n=1 Tax=Candidatus Woesebacteria bacterium RIFCSPLOWO2_01_FULL_44_14 TaxID=1802525 RepID=A0A1F8C0T2_9BACT|nr:MAG: hypothetical protein A2630_02180 [Candidatus Woesebacteria bacterium RIFCSPHIGHO2_01_FULL_44_10]OGM53969.1 MAG: hypothetical protein A3F62_00160 [Candidatus Woesebacteria bacterium RIFCSPHIGHO2_12_FULL_44_11]OGM69937.1 MAG: hypothetical protein A2975_04995 [Candidatus Woesebacteria bacterium RIFCSPLOWO2_01_FULL_44_14]
MKKHILIVLIVALAFFLRIYKISANPSALNWDEVSHGYNAYSILKTGKDEWGKPFPIIFRAYGDYKLPVYIYLIAISEFFFGLNEFAVRLPSVLAGTGVVLFTYLLVNELFRSKKTALLAALLMAVEPWSLFLSRVAVEANVALFFIISGVYFFVKKKYLPAILLLGVSVWTYNSARVFVPLLLASLHIIYKPKLTTNYLLLATVFLVPMFYQLINPVGQARYGAVRILDEGTIAQIVENRAGLNLPSPIPRLVHNKATYFVSIVWSNYFTHFNPDFLFFKGGSHYQFNVPGHGLLYWINVPFLLLGFYLLARNFKEKSSQLILVWLILSPLASSLTREAPHALRSIVMLPAPMILTALGVTYLFKKPITLLIYIIIVAVFTGSYLRNYFINYRQEYSWSWQYGYKQAVTYIKENYENYDKIIVTKKYGEPHEFLLFWWPWDPAIYRSDPNLNRFYQSNWYWVDSFDKFYFVNDWQAKDLVLESGGDINCADSSCLLITSPDNAPEGFSKIETINFLDNTPAFEIYAN